MKFILSFLLVFLASCGTPIIESPSPLTKQAMANFVRNETIEKLKERNLYACGYGSGMMDQIKVLTLAFRYYNDVDINQARELLMTAGTVFLNEVNSNEQIRPFLQNYPFKPENIQISIYLQKPDGSEPDLEKLTVVSLKEGVLTYKIYESDKHKFLTIYKETYYEAAAKLNVVIPNVIQKVVFNYLTLMQSSTLSYC